MRRSVVTAVVAALAVGGMTYRQRLAALPTAPEDRILYRRLLARGTRPFFEARGTACPWCGSQELAPKLTTSDLAQHKPGTFHLDRCQNCGHVFQNPRLSPEGLDFYYRDFYDGPYANILTRSFETDGPRYQQRADLVRRHHERHQPQTWLDVGTGHGHFCHSARDVFPHTRFEGLDRGESVRTAEERGWIDKAHHGLLTDLADELDGRFDVVSMHHYLEHTPDPRRDLAAAKRMLRPRGYLSLELPDPGCRAGSLLGRWWGPWFQPQHLHLAPLANVCEALRFQGFSVVATERQEAHEPLGAAVAAFLMVDRLAPRPDLPWRQSGPWSATWRALAFTLGAPALVAAYLVDRLAGPLVRRLPGGPNAYRILARLDQPAEQTEVQPTDLPDWGRALLDALSPLVGCELTFAADPTPVESPLAASTFDVELAATGGGTLPPAWRAPSVVRLADDRADLEREAAAIDASTSRGLDAPSVRATVKVDDRWALVTNRPDGTPLLQMIGSDFGRVDELLASFATHQAQLHDRTVGIEAAGTPLPVVTDPVAEIARIDPVRYESQVAWLYAKAATPGPGVLCHGSYEPMCASVPDHGDKLTVSNWAGALVAERELDVGLTLMNFWVAPAFVEHRAVRTQFKMVRDKLASRYLRCYGEHAALDRQRLTFWQAFHALRALAQLDAAYDAAGSPFRQADRLQLPAGLAKELERLFRIVTARERRGL